MASVRQLMVVRSLVLYGGGGGVTRLTTIIRTMQKTQLNTARSENAVPAPSQYLKTTNSNCSS